MNKKKKISISKKGQYPSLETRKKLSDSRIGELNPKWKGDLAGKSAMHKWIERKLGKPNFCEICKRTDKKSYDWSNKNHTYRRIIKEWQRLCSSCHKKYDSKNMYSMEEKLEALLSLKN